MAEHIEVNLAVETDADRRLKEWEALKKDCPALNEENENLCDATKGWCGIKSCLITHWSDWR